MIKLTHAQEQDISRFIEMESAEDTNEFITPYSLTQHQNEMAKSNVIYLSIISGQQVVGFIILATVNNFVDVEFRRIVVAAKGKGLGQLAIKAMEQYCFKQLNSQRIWLDVFKNNERGQYIYKKLGFKVFIPSDKHHGSLTFYQKISNV